MDIKGIYEGYSNALKRSDQLIENKAKRRLAVCRACPLRKQTFLGDVCGKCGCPLSALTRQNSKICQNWRIYNVV